MRGESPTRPGIFQASPLVVQETAMCRFLSMVTIPMVSWSST